MTTSRPKLSLAKSRSRRAVLQVVLYVLRLLILMNSVVVDTRGVRCGWASDVSGHCDKPIGVLRVATHHASLARAENREFNRPSQDLRLLHAQQQLQERILQSLYSSHFTKIGQTYSARHHHPSEEQK